MAYNSPEAQKEDMQVLLETAKEAARLGGRVLREELNGSERRRVEEKERHDFVTEVDRLAERAVLEHIRARHPGHQILAEESGLAGEKADHLWIVDPLDGTSNYIHDFPFFCVSVAVQERGELAAAAIYDPLRDELFHAEKGGGAWLNGERISVTGTDEPGRCLVATGFPFRAKHLSDAYFAALNSLFHKTGDFRRAGSAALDLAYVACGRVDAFWEVTLKPWDIAAGILLVEEAGGRTSDIWGGDGQLECGHIAASNGHLHEELVATVGPCFRDRAAMKG